MLVFVLGRLVFSVRPVRDNGLDGGSVDITMQLSWRWSRISTGGTSGVWSKFAVTPGGRHVCTRQPGNLTLVMPLYSLLLLDLPEILCGLFNVLLPALALPPSFLLCPSSLELLVQSRIVPPLRDATTEDPCVLHSGGPDTAGSRPEWLGIALVCLADRVQLLTSPESRSRPGSSRLGGARIAVEMRLWFLLFGPRKPDSLGRAVRGRVSRAHRVLWRRRWHVSSM